MRIAITAALKRFLKTTTLHGFKYFNSPYYFDRVSWTVCAVISASCAGGLCAALWARFSEVPALLSQRDVRLEHLNEAMPLVSVCPTPETAARLLAKHLSLNTSETKWLPLVFKRLLRDLIPETEHLQLLDNLLTARNLTLGKALLDSTTACRWTMTRCRFQNRMVPCRELFKKQTTHWGACCILNHGVLEKKFNYEGVNKQLAIVMRCDEHCSEVNACENCLEFFTRYRGEVEALPSALTPGNQFYAHIIFAAVRDRNTENIVDGTCVSDVTYSRNRCWTHCGERFCGCSDPLRIVDAEETNVPPPCSVSRFPCIMKWRIDENECKCLPACKTFNSDLTVESSALDAVSDSVDPFYDRLNETTSIVLHIHIKITRSKQYERISTETLLTLLSSLGGVFNMFLGVGLFSALEILFFILVRLPVAIRKSPKIDNNVIHRIPTVVLPRNRIF